MIRWGYICEIIWIIITSFGMTNVIGIFIIDEFSRQ